MDTFVFVVILGISAALSATYAEVLKRHPHWYRYNGKTWVTVVIGALCILGTLVVCALFGLITFYAVGQLTAVTIAWGGPIILWQLSQSSAENALYEQRARRKNNHDEETRR